MSPLQARVIGHEAGKGRNAGRCGALRCEMACGKKFSCGSGSVSVLDSCSISVKIVFCL